jgi:hypothetical protein
MLALTLGGFDEEIQLTIQEWHGIGICIAFGYLDFRLSLICFSIACIRIFSLGLIYNVYEAIRHNVEEIIRSRSSFSA